MSPKLLIILMIGTILMLFPITIQSFWYKIRFWKSIIIAITLTVVGTAGTYLMYYLENGYFDGVSFYGAVFLVPLVFIMVSWILRVPYSQIMDLCAPAECIMLALMKTQCLLSGCCAGRILFITSMGTEIRFPSQIMEFLNALVLFAILLFFAYKKKRTGNIYPLYLVLYGSTRFVLNFFRDIWGEGMGIPFGTIWSICAFCIGLCLLVWLKRRKANVGKQTINT